MIWLVVICYFSVIVGAGVLLISANARDFLSAFPRVLSQRVTQAMRRLLRVVLTADAKQKTAGNYHQVWVFLAGLVMLIAPVVWAATRQSSVPSMDYELFRDRDPQVYALLEGEMLVPPPEVATDLIVEAEKIARSAEAISPNGIATGIPLESSMLQTADRKWNRMNPRYVQRLLLVFKLMKQRYGYDMVLLEGYRSPERQNRLAALGANVTHASGFRSYHQFGLAGDLAFLRDGKVVITEKDPWAMQGYQYYGEVAESVGLTWGGRWKMMDLGHTEFRMRGVLGNAEVAQKLTSESVDSGAPKYE
jgi:peptidoglycan L-alanyl-D-glutamate endopeptidase CwlK